MHVALTETPTPRTIKPVPADPTTERFPFRRDIALAEARLYVLGYDEATVDLILADIRRCGSAWCSAHFNESSEIEHAEIIEAILENHADWNSPVWDAEVVMAV